MRATRDCAVHILVTRWTASHKRARAPSAGTVALLLAAPASSLPPAFPCPRDGTTLCSSLNGMPLALFCAPDTTVHMLAGEDAGTRCLDFSSDGRLLVGGRAERPEVLLACAMLQHP